MNPRLIEIRGGGGRAWVYPEQGFQLYGYEQELPGGKRAKVIHATDLEHEPADRRYGNPVLFPNPSAAITDAGPDTWTWKGKTLSMPFHGFARNLYWQVVESAADHVTGELVPNSSALVSFPFKFRMRLTYRLGEEGLVLDALVSNTGDEPFPYAFGLHPYIAAPLGPLGSVADCSIALPTGVELKSKDGWRTMGGRAVAARVAPANEDMVDSILLTELVTKHVELQDLANGMAARVSVEGSGKDFPVWVIWSATPASPFVCLEPWTDAPNALNRRETRRCGPGETHRYRVVISVRAM